MSFLARIANVLGLKGADEGAYRPGPWYIDTGPVNGWLPSAWGQYLNFWQMGYNPLPGGSNATVEACVSAYAQTVAMCPLYHWGEQDNGGRTLIKTSALSRFNRAPNDYQTRSDFLSYAVRSLYLDGNAYALALRNSRFEVASLHLMHPRRSWAYAVNGEVYYDLGGNSVIDSRVIELGLDPNMLRAVPARDVLHIKLDPVENNILRGESPLLAAALAIAAGNTALTQQIQFFANQSRPSGILSTDLAMNEPAAKELRRAWDEQAKGLARGGVPILTHGLKFESIAVSAADAQMVEAVKMSDDQVAKVFRVPLAIIGSDAQPMGSTEALMQFWIRGGLGFALDRVELAFDRLYALDRFATGEYSELDTSVLLRSAFKDRIEGLTRAVQGGIYSPNEARRLEQLPDAEDGDEPRVQQQVVPLTFADKQLEAKAAAAAAPPAAPANDNPPADGGDQADAGDNAAGKMTVTDWNRYFEGAA